MMTNKRIRPWRRIAGSIQAITIIGLPFLKINGESALRFDVPELQLHFFGVSLWIEEFFIVLVATIFISLLIILVTLILGRIWCGWLCPQTVINDLTSFIEKSKKRGPAYKTITYTGVLLISALISANLIWYFVSPYDFFPALIEGRMGNVVWGSWIVMTVIIFLNFLLLRHRFCSTVCPYAKLQTTLFDSKTLTVMPDPRRIEECIDCLACVKTCPVKIDIRNGLDAACIHCAECIDSCAEVMEKRNKGSLIGYFFGEPEGEGKILRPGLFLFGSATALFLVLFIYLLSVRIPLDMTVLPNYSFQPRFGVQGKAVNSYILSVRNRGRSDEELSIEAVGLNGDMKIIPDNMLRVKAGEARKVPVYVSVKDLVAIKKKYDIDIIIRSLKDVKLKIAGKAVFIIPEE